MRDKPQSVRKLRTRNDSKLTEPKVGIFYLVGKKLLVDSTPLAQAALYGDHLIHDRDHIEYWAQQILTSTCVSASDEYEEHPRGRVAYNEKSRTYTLFADRCILRRKDIVAKIVSQMNLPIGRLKVDTDPHYRCYCCLGRSLSRQFPSRRSPDGSVTRS
jgi:hypothetical protein